MGFLLKFCFGIADTNANTNSTAGMFVGLLNATTTPWAANYLPNTILSCVGIGHDPAESKIAFYDKGSTSGTKVLTSFNTTIPDTRWFHLTLYNPFNSNNITMTLTDSISGTSESRTITAGTATSQLSNTTRLYPCIQRMYGATAPTGAAQVHFGSMTLQMI